MRVVRRTKLGGSYVSKCAVLIVCGLFATAANSQVNTENG